MKILSKIFTIFCSTCTTTALIGTTHNITQCNNNAQMLNNATASYCTINFKTITGVVYEGQTVIRVKTNRKFGSVTTPDVLINGERTKITTWVDENGKEYTSNTIIDTTTASIILTPKLDSIEAKLTFNLMGGEYDSKSTIDPIKVNVTTQWSDIENAPKDASKFSRDDGRKFKAWVKPDGTAVEDTTTFSENTVLTADWEESEKMIVEFKTEVGTFDDGSTHKIFKNIPKGKSLKDAGYTLPTLTLPSWVKNQKFTLNDNDFTDETEINCDCVVKIYYEADFATCDWSDIDLWTQKLEDEEITDEIFLKHYWLDDTQPTDFGDFVNKTKTLKVNDLDHTVRVIDTKHDTINDTTKKAIFTFEYSNLWSVGESYWVGAHDVMIYAIEENLIYMKEAGFVPRIVTKSFYDYDSSEKTWSMENYEAQVFQLTLTEAGVSGAHVAEGTIYAAYSDQTTASRIKTSVSGSEGAKYWVKSKYYTGRTDVIGWYIDASGVATATLSDSKYAVVPAFCL